MAHPPATVFVGILGRGNRKVKGGPLKPQTALREQRQHYQDCHTDIIISIYNYYIITRLSKEVFKEEQDIRDRVILFTIKYIFLKIVTE